MSCEALVGEGRSRTCENEGQCCMCICMLSTSELLQESVAIYMFEIVCIACNACSNYIILLCDAHGHPIHWRNVLIYGLSRKHAAPTYLSFCCHLYGCACNVCPCIHMCLWVSAYACIESEHTLHCVLFWIPSHRATVGTYTLLPTTHVYTFEWCFTERVIMYGAMPVLYTVCTVMHAYKFLPHTWWHMQ